MPGTQPSLKETCAGSTSTVPCRSVLVNASRDSRCWSFAGVAALMEADLNPPLTKATTSFLSAGDCVYGEKSRYPIQFYEPYEFYRGRNFPVPVNYNGENCTGQNALMVSSNKRLSFHNSDKAPYGNDSNRMTMVRAHVYWTSPIALPNTVGLNSNVPEDGGIQIPSDRLARQRT